MLRCVWVAKGWGYNIWYYVVSGCPGVGAYGSSGHVAPGRPRLLAYSML